MGSCLTAFRLHFLFILSIPMITAILFLVTLLSPVSSFYSHGGNCFTCTPSTWFWNQTPGSMPMTISVPSGYGYGRRNLDSAAMNACTSPPDADVHNQCSQVITMGAPSVSAAFQDPEVWAEQAVHYYCCVLRQSEPSMVYKTVFQYHETCALASPFLQNTPEEGSFLSIVAKFCPNSIAPSVPSDDARSRTLFKVAAAERTGVPVSNCAESGSSNEGKLTILVPESQSDNDVAHFPAFIGSTISEESWVSWEAVRSECSFDLFVALEGMAGQFGSVYSVKAEHALVIEGLDEAAMLAKKLELAETTTTYQVVDSNCSHQLLHILAAGMGCEAEMIPFYHPSALMNALDKMENSQRLDDAALSNVEDMIDSFLNADN